MRVTQKLEADLNGLSKVLDTGSCVRRQLCLRGELLNLLISQQVHLRRNMMVVELKDLLYLNNLMLSRS